MARIGRGHQGIYKTSGEKNTNTNVIESFNSPPSETSLQVDNERFEMLDKYWSRENEILDRVEQREDTAYQRAVKDMLSAGIDPQLASVTLQPAQSGGGITNASRIEEVGNTKLSNESQEKIEELRIKLQKELKEMDIGQKEKDLISNFFSDIINGITRILSMGMIAK